MIIKFWKYSSNTLRKFLFFHFGNNRKRTFDKVSKLSTLYRSEKSLSNTILFKFIVYCALFFGDFTVGTFLLEKFCLNFKILCNMFKISDDLILVKVIWENGLYKAMGQFITSFTLSTPSAKENNNPKNSKKKKITSNNIHWPHCVPNGKKNKQKERKNLFSSLNDVITKSDIIVVLTLFNLIKFVLHYYIMLRISLYFHRDFRYKISIKWKAIQCPFNIRIFCANCI